MLKIFILITTYLVAVASGDEADPFCIASRCCSRGCMLTSLRKAGYSIQQSQSIAKIVRKENRRCSCHPTCQYFGTCCTDADSGNYLSSANMFSYSKCLITQSGLGARVIDRCPPALPSDDIRVKNCHEMDNISEDARGYNINVLNGTSAYTTSAVTQLTYKNRWCALCNMEKKENLLEWNLEKTESCRIDEGVKRCVYRQTPPVHTKLYGDNKLMENFYMEDLYLFHNDDVVNVCEARDVRYCPDNTQAELNNACLYGPQRVVQDSKTGVIYANSDCAKCHNIDTLKSCKGQLHDVSEKIIEQNGFEVVSPSSTSKDESLSTVKTSAENQLEGETESDLDTSSTTSSTTSTTSMPSTKSTSYPPTWPEVTESTASSSLTGGSSTKSTTMSVTDVWFPSSDSTSSSSSTSTTTSPSTTTSSTTTKNETAGNELNVPSKNNQEGWFPHGSVLVSRHGSPQGHPHSSNRESQELAPKDNASENELHSETETGDQGNPIPSGTQIVVNNSHPRGVVLSANRFSLDNVRDRMNKN